VSKRVCGGASTGGSTRVSKILDLVSHNATVTGEWYIPGHKPRGLCVSPPGFEFSSSLGKCEYTETKFEGEKVGSIELGDLGMFGFSFRQFFEQVEGILVMKARTCSMLLPSKIGSLKMFR